MAGSLNFDMSFWHLSGIYRWHLIYFPPPNPSYYSFHELGTFDSLGEYIPNTYSFTVPVKYCHHWKKTSAYETRFCSINISLYSQEGVCHAGTRSTRCAFVGDTEMLITVGTTRGSERELSLWNQVQPWSLCTFLYSAESTASYTRTLSNTEVSSSKT